MKVDLTNRKFGFLKALYPTTKRVQRKVVWRCECICGKECEVLSTNLTSGRTVSCGCKKYEIVSKHYRDKSPKQGEIINGTKCSRLLEVMGSTTQVKDWVFKGGESPPLSRKEER